MTKLTVPPKPSESSGLPDAVPVHGYVPAFDTADGNEDPAPPAVTHSTVPKVKPASDAGSADAGIVNAPAAPTPG